MPHLAAAAAAPNSAARVAFLRPGPGPVPCPPLNARALRRDMRTAEQPTFYDLLGISSEGTLDEVRAAYRRMARKYHPDVSPPDAAAENTSRFIEVQEAYETLSDPSRRATYDRALARGVCRLAFSAPRRVAPYYHYQVPYINSVFVGRE
ncbi:chaperone protein dnaJ 20, chloroplastic-like [Oryza brachyantha]|uniref:chaperone protein dnaJ 20, chloroplastic-like n=1 Tax=Oryza brachyantha TaxID=4533 RepID=UPI001AD9D510|nr:chaperone protein dnaJ 20, chloroplastic-like [Oryza brachyantha]